MSKTSGFLQKNLLRWLPGMLISLAAILFLIYFIDWSEFGTTIQSFSMGLVFLLILLSLVALLFRSMAWRVLLNQEASLTDTYFIESVGYLLSNFLPLRLGEIGRAILMGQRTGRGSFYTLSSIAIERIMDMGFAAIIFMAALPLFSGSIDSQGAVIITFSIVLLVLCGIYLIARNNEKVITWLRRISAGWHWFTERLMPIFASLIEGLKVFSSFGIFLKVTFFLGLAWLSYLTSFYLVIRATNPGAPLWWALFLGGVVSLGIAIPSAPGSLGLWEASFVGAIALLGGNETGAIAGAIVLHLINYLITGVLGLIGLVRFGSSFSAIFQEIKKQKGSAGD